MSWNREMHRLWNVLCQGSKWSGGHWKEPWAEVAPWEIGKRQSKGAGNSHKARNNTCLVLPSRHQLQNPFSNVWILPHSAGAHQGWVASLSAAVFAARCKTHLFFQAVSQKCIRDENNLVMHLPQHFSCRKWCLCILHTRVRGVGTKFLQQ